MCNNDVHGTWRGSHMTTLSPDNRSTSLSRILLLACYLLQLLNDRMRFMLTSKQGRVIFRLSVGCLSRVMSVYIVYNW
jgi:hypothetical protein